MKINLDIYGKLISIKGDREAVSRIEKDFSYFITENPDEKADAEIAINCIEPDLSMVSGKKARFLHPQFKMYKADGVKVIDYRGKAVSFYNEKEKNIRIYSSDCDLLHELGYLTVLSIAGDMVEKDRLFRIHGAALGFNDHGSVFLASSGGWKTTLFWDIIKRNSVNFFSDDVALIDNSMNLNPMPLRIGIKSEDSSRFRNVPAEFLYEIKRRKYGAKLLLDTRWLRHKISKPLKIKSFIKLERKDVKAPVITKRNKIFFVRDLIENLIIGMGLPQVMEYMQIDCRIGNLNRQLQKLYNRTVLAFKLIFLCDYYCAYLSGDTEKNADAVFNFFNKT